MLTDFDYKGLCIFSKWFYNHCFLFLLFSCNVLMGIHVMMYKLCAALFGAVPHHGAKMNHLRRTIGLAAGCSHQDLCSQKLRRSNY